jgi:hypothetical protein
MYRAHVARDCSVTHNDTADTDDAIDATADEDDVFDAMPTRAMPMPNEAAPKPAQARVRDCAHMHVTLCAQAQQAPPSQSAARRVGSTTPSTLKRAQTTVLTVAAPAPAKLSNANSALALSMPSESAIASAKTATTAAATRARPASDEFDFGEPPSALDDVDIDAELARVEKEIADAEVRVGYSYVCVFCETVWCVAGSVVCAHTTRAVCRGTRCRRRRRHAPCRRRRRE